jgi:predicted methyltransferase
MRCRKVTYHCLIAATLVFAISQIPYLIPPAWAGENGAAKPKDRAQSVRAIVSHLGLGEGSVIADIGAGNGRDTWVFAELVGETGTVHPEEITENKVKSLKAEAEKRGLSQVRPVLGRSYDPCLPQNSVDLVYMNHVYHHFARPREMLRGIWRGLKPGGRLVIVDRELGTLRNWVERKLRESKHWWIAETTVVREAREEGFAFTDCAEECWYSGNEFVLVFERPQGLESPGSDPDAFLSVPAEKCAGLLCPVARPYQRPVFVALGQTRELMAPILESSSGEGLEIVLEEWATQKDERPPLPGNVSLPSVLTDRGDPSLPDEPIDAVFFLDTYHLLFHGQTLLARLHEKLSPAGCVYVLDRLTKEPLSRREASHRRKIEPKTVRQEMAKAGFHLWGRGPRPARDRFLLVFGKAPPDNVPPEDDPLVGGPAIGKPPGQWLRQNLWRLRALKTANGSLVPLRSTGRKGPVENVGGDSPAVENWNIPKEKLALSFRKKGDGYLLTDCRASDGQ